MPDESVQRGTGALSRRRLLAAGGGAALAALAGCSGRVGGGAETPEEITFLHFETQEERRSTIGEIASDWTEESDVAVNQRAIAEADLPQEISSAVASNTLPAAGELAHRALFSARDALSNEDAGTVIDDLGADNFYDSVLSQVADGDGGHVGVPLYTWQQIHLYRPSVREEMGLPEPTTWENFEAFAEATHDPDNDVYGCLLGSDASQFTLQCFQPFALSNGARVFDADGNIVFDQQPMVEALRFYGRMVRRYNPPGDIGPGDVGPIWGNGQTHLYSSNTISFFFEALGVEEGQTVDSVGAVPTFERQREGTFGEVVSTATFSVGEGARQASNDFQTFLRSTEGGTESPYIRWLHMQVGLFNPVLTGILDSEAYRDQSNISKWPDRWLDELIPNAIDNMERLGFQQGEVHPEIGQITGNFLITEAIREVIDGGDAQQVAQRKAEEMRNLLE